MYDIGISEINITERSVSDDGRAILYRAEAAQRPDHCPFPGCKSKVKPHIHGHNDNLIHDIKSEGKLVYINLDVKRYKCPDCGNVFPDEFTFFPKNGHITNRLKKEFVDRCIKGETFTYIGKDYSVDHKTVAAAFGDYTDKNKELFSYTYTPEVLGLDEAHIDDHFRLVITDIKEQRLLDMKRDNKYGTVKKYLNTLDKDVCGCVTMDFAPVYAKAVRIVLPQAFVVIDKFHAVQEVNRCLDRTRVEIQNSLKKQGVNIRQFKKSKYIFMTNWEDLSPETTDILNNWLMQYPDLYSAYMTKEAFRDIYNLSKDREEATVRFDKWLKTIPDFEKFSAMKKTMIQRRDHILNYWDAPYTNAYTESVNNLIKKTEKAGRGYKFETLRKRCMLEINTPKPGKFDPKTATFITNDGEIRTLSEKAGSLYMMSIAQEAVEPAKKEVSSGAFDVIYTLNDSFDVYVEYFDQTKRYESMVSRFKAYYDAISKFRYRQG